MRMKGKTDKGHYKDGEKAEIKFQGPPARIQKRESTVE